ncbi:DUF2079 domain-containing protein [Georgenia yuyongxinii]
MAMEPAADAAPGSRTGAAPASTASTAPPAAPAPPATTPAGRSSAAAPHTRADRVVPWALAGAVAALYSAFAVTQWRRLESPSWDLGIFTQLAKAYAHLEAPIVPIKGEGFNLLGDHFHPLLVLLGPVYRLFPSGLGLLILQAVLLGLSVVPVASVARELLGRGRGTALGVAYGLSWACRARSRPSSTRSRSRCRCSPSRSPRSCAAGGGRARCGPRRWSSSRRTWA